MPYMQLMENRIGFLNIDDKVIAELKKVRSILEPSIDGILDRFYEELLKVPDLHEILNNPETIERARAAQKKHWLEALLSGPYDNDYYDRTGQIGKAHAKIGLTPSWYIGAYNMILCEFIERIEQYCEQNGLPAERLIQAVSKVVFLDMDLVIHRYLEDKDVAMRNMLRRSSEFRNDMWAITDRVNERADHLQLSIQKFARYDDGTEGREQQLDALLTEVDELRKETRNLDRRMRKLPLSDKLYLPRRNIFGRIWATIFGDGV